MKTIRLPHSSLYTGNLILVNAAHPYRENFTEHSFLPVNSVDIHVMLKSQAVALLSKVMQKLEGWNSITAVSGLRSMQEQKDIYTQSLKDNGPSFTQKFVALPGHSEHQTELAHEPWHFRYVGTPHAEIMTAHGFVLEEYLEFLKQYSYGKNSIIIYHHIWM